MVGLDSHTRKSLKRGWPDLRPTDAAGDAVEMAGNAGGNEEVSGALMAPLFHVGTATEIKWIPVAGSEKSETWLARTSSTMAAAISSLPDLSWRFWLSRNHSITQVQESFPLTPSYRALVY
ncbi:hypothetical protein [Tahibacter amnicola]|uniref:Uncharacterized protein n=1 Tax=Tahibacter amnicola TaxID=2976241 RepID=A0ABY6BJL5_9GAMM|nr:hypothetical protein [Tahibacter amnicola]UXI69290.1 hypothetical protein N4264_06475 [Tahibacter amnicola]